MKTYTFVIGSIDDFDLEILKKEKLLIKDRMAIIIEDYRHTHI